MELNVDVAGLMVDRLARMSLHLLAEKSEAGTPRRGDCGCQEVGQEDFRGHAC